MDNSEGPVKNISSSSRHTNIIQTAVLVKNTVYIILCTSSVKKTSVEVKISFFELAFTVVHSLCSHLIEELILNSPYLYLCPRYNIHSALAFQGKSDFQGNL